ncbi:MAG: DUF2851 family protein [Bacteroidota bacterium]
MEIPRSYPEEIFQFIWKNRYFHQVDITTKDQQKIYIVDPGEWNHNQGPDFLNATIQINHITWNGHIEIHRYTREWFQHQHHLDTQYDNTILHVVYESGPQAASRTDGSIIPELELKPYIDPTFLSHYHTFRNSGAHIPCHHLLKDRIDLPWKVWQDGWAEERMQHKIEQIREVLGRHQHDYAQLLWQILLRTIGGKTNGIPFEMLAERIPYRLIQRYQDVFDQETLLFGGLGLLRGQGTDDYHRSMIHRWQYLAHKHELPDWEPLPLKHLRMRPVAFPMIRLAQIAQLLHVVPSLTQLLDQNGILFFLSLEIGVSSYWRSHHRWGKVSKDNPKTLGPQSREMLAANVFIPISILHSLQYQPQKVPLLLKLLASFPAEDNRITRIWNKYKVPHQHMMHSQALYHLYTQYCTQKKCLSCKVGQTLLK